jgi:hypothetical protein
MTTQLSATTDRRPLWPWAALVAGLAWTVLLRVPLVLNAADHLDSDLAVDGLTLLDARNGHWRWHFPGTPYMGILPLLTCYPQALIGGANPISLVSGGTVIWVLVVASSFWLAYRVFGPQAAGWAIVPLVFSSLGTIWLSGRVTGGHLLTLVWHNIAFVAMHVLLTRGGWISAAALGAWCGLGLYLDAMFLFTLAGLLAAALLGRSAATSWRSVISRGAVFTVAMMAGFAPHVIGRWVDRHDAYPSQFAATLDRQALVQHARLMGEACIPRLVAGIELPTLLDEIDMVAAWGPDVRVVLASLADQPENLFLLARVFCGVVSLATCAAGVIWLALDPRSPADRARRAIRFGVLAAALLIMAAFVANRNIFNSDNYRYLVFLLTPWSMGFGLMARDLAAAGWPGRLAALVLTGLLAGAMALAALCWYVRDQRYVDPRLRPLRVEVQPWDLVEVSDSNPSSGSGPLRSFTFRIPRDVTHVFGPYWEVYRLSFLSGGRVVGVPLPIFPNRFAGWSRGLGEGVGALLVLRPSANWRNALAAVWRADGRATADLQRLRIIVPSHETSRP